MNFRTFLEYNPLHIPTPVGGNTVGTHNDSATATFQSSGVWTDLSIPSVVVQSRISKVLNAKADETKKRQNDKSNKDPIKIILDKGTVIEMPAPRYEDLLAAGKQIVPGKTIRVTFQRNPLDKSRQSSRIEDIQVL